MQNIYSWFLKYISLNDFGFLFEIYSKDVRNSWRLD